MGWALLGSGLATVSIGTGDRTCTILLSAPFSLVLRCSVLKFFPSRMLRQFPLLTESRPPRQVTTIALFLRGLGLVRTVRKQGGLGAISLAPWAAQVARYGLLGCGPSVLSIMPRVVCQVSNF